MPVCQPIPYVTVLKTLFFLVCSLSINSLAVANTFPVNRVSIICDTIPGMPDSPDHILQQKQEVISNLLDSSAFPAPDVSGAAKRGKQQLKGGLSAFKPKDPLKKLGQLEAPKAPGLKGLLQNGQVSISNDGQLERSYFGSGYYYLNHLQINGGIQVAKIPLAVQFQRQDMFQYRYYYNNIFQVRFDKEAYLENYRKKLASQVSMDELVPKDALLQQTKAVAEKAIRAEMDSMKGEYLAMTGAPLTAIDTLKDFTKPEVNTAFQTLLSSKYAREIKEKEALLQQMKEKAQRGDTAGTAQMGNLKKEIDAYYKLLSFYKRYQQLRNKFNLPGLNKQLAQDELQRAKKYGDMLQDPESLKKLASEKLPLTGAEKFFLNVQRMNMGQQTVSLSSLSLYNYMHTGASMEIYNNNKYLFVLVGKEKDLNAVYDRAYFTPVQSNDHIATGIRLGRGPLDGNHTHLSLFSFKQSRSYAEGQSWQMPSKSSVVLGLSNRVAIDETSSIDLEISKSSTVYTDAAYGLDSTGRKSALGQLFRGDDFAQSLALTLKYKASFKEIGLDVNADVAHIAAGYYNPGSSFLPRGTKQGILGLRKSFLKKKIMLNLRGDMREYAFGSNTGMKWRSSSFLIDTRFKLSNGQQVGLKYQPTRGVQISSGSRLLNNATDRVSVDLNLQKIFGRIFYHNMISTAYSNTRYLQQPTGMIAVKASTFTCMQNITLGTSLLYWNNTYNYSRNPAGLVYLNSSYNTDAGITYQWGERFSFTSGVNYTSAAGWYRQLGGRQAITATINSKLDASVFVDGRVNLNQYTNYYDDLFRVDWSLKYHF